VARWFPLGCAAVAGAAVSAAHAFAPPVEVITDGPSRGPDPVAAMEAPQPVVTLPFITMPPPPSAFLPAAALPLVRVTIGTPIVSGRLPAAVVTRGLSQSRDRFRRCYAEGLAADPGLEGEVQARLVIGRDGAVAGASETGPRLPDPEVAACVLGALRTAAFPAPDGGIATVAVALRFAPRR
jgi:hypothetical protein